MAFGAAARDAGLVPRFDSADWPPGFEPGFEHLLRELADGAARHDRDGTFPAEAFPKLVALGVPGLTAPRSHGGWNLDLRRARQVVERLGAADPSVALVTVWQLLFLAELAREDHGWPEAARRAVLGTVRDEGAWINAVNVEPELGTPARGGLPATRAVRSAGGSWRLNGRKIYATGIPVLRWILLSVTLDDEKGQRSGIVLVDAHQPGIRVEETWDHIGLRASGSHDVHFEDVEIPADFVVADGPSSRPLYDARRHGWACVLVASLYNGVARAARDWLLHYLNHRTPSGLGAPLATLPRFQSAVGQIELQRQTSDRLLDDVAAAIDAGTEAEQLEAQAFAPLLKHLVTSNAIAITNAALELTGNPGHSRHNPLERHHRDALTGRIHTPQADFALLNAGKAALVAAGPPASPSNA